MLAQSHTTSSEMAGVPVAQLSDEQKGELLCTYSALILHDDGAEISPQSMTNLIKAAGCTVEGYWPMLMSKMVNTVCVLARGCRRLLKAQAVNSRDVHNWKRSNKKRNNERQQTLF